MILTFFKSVSYNIPTPVLYLILLHQIRIQNTIRLLLGMDNHKLIIYLLNVQP